MKPFTGSWQIVASPDFDPEYLTCEGPPGIRLRQQGDRVEGSYSFGPQHGQLDGRTDGPERLICSFEGMDGEELVNGAAIALLQEDRLLLRLMYHFGPDRTLEGIRPPASPAHG